MAKNITLMNNDGTEVLYPKGQLVGIDTSKLLATFGDTTFEYTATEDCFVCSKNVNVYINGVVVEETRDCYIVPLKKGQTFSTTNHSYSVTYIYGVKN